MKDGERSDGVRNIAANTNELPVIDVSIKGILRTEFVMKMVLGREALLPSRSLSKLDSFALKAIVCYIHTSCYKLMHTF